ncbi:unnamed protein product [Periconia digitata]|uniref:Uncharacterized protein n=1 Tax=Periconia digitata TaxID=1303443 RepID=A0A9W4U9Y5_9PLEO|nr:unnamed protein product [Periconia digitata]
MPASISAAARVSSLSTVGSISLSSCRTLAFDSSNRSSNLTNSFLANLPLAPLRLSAILCASSSRLPNRSCSITRTVSSSVPCSSFSSGPTSRVCPSSRIRELHGIPGMSPSPMAFNNVDFPVPLRPTST